MNDNCVYIGVDPGLSGGIALIYPNKVQVIPMPLAGKELDVERIIQFIPYVATNVAMYACIEKVGAMSPGKIAIASLNFSAGLMQGILRARRIPLDVVRPQDWKKEILVGTDKSKNAAIAWCRRVFPDVQLNETPKSHKFHDGMAEAVCLAEYCRRKFK